MPSTRSLVTNLRAEYPDYTFVSGDTFAWSAPSATLTYDPSQVNWQLLLLHELGHALLDHTSYQRDIDLLKMERDAWEHVRTSLATIYNLTYSDALAQEHLDTYRDWLHARSSCPSCQATGLQVNRHHYRCLACRQEWTVNEARLCALRRYTVTK